MTTTTETRAQAEHTPTPPSIGTQDRWPHASFPDEYLVRETSSHCMAWVYEIEKWDDKRGWFWARGVIGSPYEATRLGRIDVAALQCKMQSDSPSLCYEVETMDKAVCRYEDARAAAFRAEVARRSEVESARAGLVAEVAALRALTEHVAALGDDASVSEAIAYLPELGDVIEQARAALAGTKGGA